MGDRPGTPRECLRNYGLVMGVSAVNFGRNRHGKGTHDFENKCLKQSFNKNRKLRIISNYAEVQFSDGTRVGQCRYIPTRAYGDPLAMLELIVAKHLEKSLEPGSKSSPHRAQPNMLHWQCSVFSRTA